MSLSGKFGVKSSAAMLANILLINGLASALFDRTEMHFSRSRPLSFTGAMASANDAAWTPPTKLSINFSRALLPTGPRYSDSLPRTDSHVSRPGEASGGASYHEKQLAGCGMRLGTGNGDIQKLAILLCSRGGEFLHPVDR
jgi:hypothetical protein